MKKITVKLLATTMLLSGVPIKQAHAAIDYSTLEAKPAASSINTGLTSPSPAYMESVLGKPTATPTQDCSSVTNANLKKLLVTDTVGPFKVTGLKPAVEALKRIFVAVKRDNPELYSQLGTAGMLCARAVRGSSPPVFSNHSWGSAVDITINGKLDARGDNKTQVGLKALNPYFRNEGFYWGAEFPTEDSMHFEVSKEQIAKWRSEGKI